MYGNPNENTIIAGDFNSWHQSWGSPYNNRKGCTILKYILKSNLITLNDGSPTNFSTYQTMTHVDLTIITPYLATQIKWKSDHELFGSDNFPIHTNLFDNQNSSRSYKVPRYKLETAYWPLFTPLTEIFHNRRPPSNKINQEAANIIKIIHQSASTAITQSNPVLNEKKIVRWWNRSFEQLRTNKNQSW